MDVWGGGGKLQYNEGVGGGLGTKGKYWGTPKTRSNPEKKSQNGAGFSLKKPKKESVRRWAGRTLNRTNSERGVKGKKGREISYDGKGN